MNRREFLKLLGIGTTTIVTIGTGLWKPPPVEPLSIFTGGYEPFDVGTGNRADLLDIIENVIPRDTLFMTEFAHIPSVRHEWMVDALR